MSKIDLRREMNHIFKEFDRYQATIGEAVVWFKFDTVESRYDDVYDERGLSYLPGVLVPVLWVDQIEDPEQYTSEGRRPTQRLRFAVSALRLNECGISSTEVHGNRTWDPRPSAPDPAQPGRPTAPWTDDRLNDYLYYDGRYYGVSNLQLRGRVRWDAIVGVSAIEKDPIDELVFDNLPTRIS